MPLTRFSIRQMEAFSAVAKYNSFAAAGESMGMTASAVSQLVSEFESVLGFRVFERTTRSVRLSASGTHYLNFVTSVLRQVQLADVAAERLRQGYAGRVRVGAPASLASADLPAAIRAYRQERPHVTVHIRDCKVEEMEEIVATGEVDMVLGPDVKHGPQVTCQVLYETPAVLWCSQSHPFATRKTLQWDDLRETNLVFVGQSHERNLAKAFLQQQEEGFHDATTVTSLTTALGLVSEGLAVTLLPAHVAPLALKFGLTLRRVGNPEVMRRVCLYRPATGERSSTMEEFEKFLIDWLAASNAETIRSI